jgi:hypothetical protein
MNSFQWRSNDMFKLAQINSLVSYDCINLFQVTPRRVYPMAARSFYQLKKTEGKNDIKTVVLEYVRNKLPDYPWYVN